MCPAHTVHSLHTAVQTGRLACTYYINFTLTFNMSAATISFGIDKVSDIRQNPGLLYSLSTDEDETVTSWQNDSAPSGKSNCSQKLFTQQCNSLTMCYVLLVAVGDTTRYANEKRVFFILYEPYLKYRSRKKCQRTFR
jgi:hypothetical protein